MLCSHAAVAAACEEWKSRHAVAGENGETQEVEEEDIYAVEVRHHCCVGVEN